ncbi:biotin/lipoyl attachment domain-containing protein [Xylanimonas cellulosilytica DSM 15894]|uniref:Biotin/lipoyl attachment domain-containing protein n=1 Tax=Xylanimonas cellulosilytica (strain DSM 15894 / JCM 12276 / CECT 5975 / KCTC 9989 / LMG 20990 / NBRC 107835 / XIL07) TaxID=446471 RepID=D1BUM9_XYLCX|nr:HlyD family secretion protein [Xylanimonas cellulosilytica]ACZ29270.1 biotin/lipoyl attachment domain-containing protein [Xylanimonas cellulosilytica DSM 15894]
MSRAAWFRLVGGVLAVTLVAGGLTWVLGRRDGQVTSFLATVQTQTVDVGVDYPGTVTDTLVKPGEQVDAGQPVLVVNSLRLAHDIAEGLLAASTVAYEVAADGTMTVLSPVAGTVTHVGVTEGQYVPGGQVLATIDESRTAHVEAKFMLDATDLTRLAIGAPVTIALPDRTRLEGTIDGFAVDNADAKAVVTATVVAPVLAREGGALTQAGTPVVASVRLAPQGPLSAVYETLDGFRQKVAGL